MEGRKCWFKIFPNTGQENHKLLFSSTTYLVVRHIFKGKIRPESWFNRSHPFHRQSTYQLEEEQKSGCQDGAVAFKQCSFLSTTGMLLAKGKTIIFKCGNLHW